MSDHEHWQLDGSAPELYERYLVPAITFGLPTSLIEQRRTRGIEYSMWSAAPVQSRASRLKE